MKIKQIIFWTGTTLGTLFFGFITFGLYSEWWNIAISKNSNGYPWGSVNETPWYYKNSETYSTVMLIEAILFSIALFVLVTQALKHKKTRVLYSFLLCFLLLVLIILSAAIK